MAKIYTRTGDAGETGLIGGRRVGKDASRVRAYGEVDELNAALGVARSALPQGDPASSVLERVQAELFELGAELADPKGKTRIAAAHSEALEREIDKMSERLPELRNFILPGGSPGGAALHAARAVCRRAERAAVALSREEKVGEQAIVYLNRLSDHLFVLARDVNERAGRREKPWLP